MTTIQRRRFRIGSLLTYVGVDLAFLSHGQLWGLLVGSCLAFVGNTVHGWRGPDDA